MTWNILYSTMDTYNFKRITKQVVKKQNKGKCVAVVYTVTGIHVHPTFGSFHYR